MKDWMREDAEYATSVGDRQDQEHQKRILDLRTYQAKGPDFWLRITTALADAAKQFSNAYPQLTPINPNEPLSSGEFNLGMGKAIISCAVDFDREVIEVFTELGELRFKPPSRFDLKIDHSGDIGVFLRGDQINIGRLVKEILGPIIRSSPRI